MAQDILITPKAGIPTVVFTGSGAALPVAINVKEDSSLEFSGVTAGVMMTIDATLGEVTIPSLNASQYVLTSVNNTLSSTVSNHIASASVHYPSSVVTSWVTSQGYASATQLNSYVLTSVNNTLSSTVSNHIASASVHYPSSVITSWVSANYSPTSHNHPFSGLTDVQFASVTDGQTVIWSSTAGKWVNVTPSEGVTDHGLLAGLGDNDHPQYVLSSTNSTLSSTVSNHIASASVHFTEASINHNAISNLTVGNPHTQYATLSGATFTGQVNGTDLDLTGQLTAAKKSFLIEHPTKPGMKLQYACLEGPENSVYVRGKTTSNVIELPDYWTGLVHEDSISVHLTPIGTYTKLNVVDTKDNKVFIESDSEINAFYIVYATRKDVEDLIVEF